ncbi:cytochrome P450 [Actinotalea sp. AC32]|nr:cytochrome P450 [Actinotalea sp. AC32]
MPSRSLPVASVPDTLAVAGTVLVPLLARGVIVRRPPVVRALAARDADRRAVRLLQRLRRTYGTGPLRLPVPGRRMVVLLDPGDVHRVLAETPDPFTAATREKRAALGHFEPANVLVSSAEDRPGRRRFHEQALDTPHTVHRGADRLVAVIHAELDVLLDRVDATGVLDWDDWARTWMRVVRRLTLGDAAADDEQVTDDMVALRAAANWAFLRPRRRLLRRRLRASIARYAADPDPSSLLGWGASAIEAGTRVEDQVPQWLFAYDAAGWATFRALALLATHPDHLADARAEADAVDLRTPQRLPLLRATVLESLRLWPTTPAVLRETVRRARFERGPVPEDTLVITYAPFFHRDDEHLDSANRLDPTLWAHERTETDWPLIPFSAGPAGCPAQNVVLHTASTVLARLVTERGLTLTGPGADVLRPPADLPGTLDMFSLRFLVTPRTTAPAAGPVPA